VQASLDEGVLWPEPWLSLNPKFTVGGTIDALPQGSQRPAGWPGSRGYSASSEPRIDRLAFEGQHSEDALMHPVQRFPCNKALQLFESQPELSESE
jgi:hypothetical protein